MNKDFDIILRHVKDRGWLAIVKTSDYEKYRTWGFEQNPLDAYHNAFTWVANNSHLIVDSVE